MGEMGHFLSIMVLEIVSYGHPVLRAKGRKVSEVDAEVLSLVEDLLETMEAANGVGLAAQQVGIPLQVCVVDITGVKDRPSEMWIDGKPVDPEDHMPLILINPEIALSGRERSGNEGCLSFPGLSVPGSHSKAISSAASQGRIAFIRSVRSTNCVADR
jgi:peptide deformylase